MTPHDDGTKILLAILLTVVLFAGVWLGAHATGYVVFNNVNAVRVFLVVTSTLLVCQVLLNAAYGQRFRFRDYGFQLSVLALVSLLTLGATTGMTQYQNSGLIVAIAVTLTVVSGLLFVNSRFATDSAELPPFWRLVSYVLGVFAFHVYIILILYPEVTEWRWPLS